MKFSIKMMLMIIAMVSTITLVNAQSKDGKGKGKSIEERVEKKTAHLQEKLDLNDKQTKQINAISLAYAQKTHEIRQGVHKQKEAGEDVDKDNVRQQMKTIRKAQAADIKAVLTPEQATKFDAIVKEHKSKKGKKGGKGKGQNIEERVEKKTAHLQEELGLSDKQKNKISTISLAYAQKAQAVRKAAHEQKEAGKEVDKDNVRQQMKTIREGQVTDIKAVLTPEQVTKFDAMVKERKSKKGKKGGKGKSDKQ